MSLSHEQDCDPSQQRGPRDPIGLLIYEARAGSVAALGQLFEGCRKYLLLVANGELDSELRPEGGCIGSGAGDLLRRAARFQAVSRFDPAELFAWLTGILTHRLSNHIRHYATRMRDVRREVPLDVDTDPELMEVWASRT